MSDANQHSRADAILTDLIAFNAGGWEAWARILAGRVADLEEQLEATQRDRDDADKLCTHWCDEYDRQKALVEMARDPERWDEFLAASNPTSVGSSDKPEAGGNSPPASSPASRPRLSIGLSDDMAEELGVGSASPPGRPTPSESDPASSPKPHAGFEERYGTDAAGNPTSYVWCNQCGTNHQRPEHCPASSLDKSLAQADRDLAEGRARSASEVFADLDASDPATESVDARGSDLRGPSGEPGADSVPASSQPSDAELLARRLVAYDRALEETVDPAKERP